MLEVIIIIIVYLIKVIKIEKDVNYKVPRFFFWIWIGKDVNLNSKVPRLKRVKGDYMSLWPNYDKHQEEVS